MTRHRDAFDADSNVAAALTFPKDAHDTLEISPKDFERDTAINLLGVYTSLRETVRGFKNLANDGLPTVFITTGNVLPWQPSGPGITLGAGKAGVVNLLQSVLMAYSATKYRYEGRCNFGHCGRETNCWRI